MYLQYLSHITAHNNRQKVNKPGYQDIRYSYKVCIFNMPV